MDEKLQDIAEVIGDVDTTIETKLSLIEAAINAQTLSLEGKLALLETAIKNLPDYSSQLEAIKTAIAGLPDYSDKLDALKTVISALPDYSSKFDAVVSALNGIKTQAEAISTGQTGIATQIGNVVSAIEDLIDEVSSGNTDAASALAAIIQKLGELKTAIENIETGGGSGSGSGNSPEDALPGKFSISDHKQVQFSKGILQATYNGTDYDWDFAANQYDFVGNAAGNTNIGNHNIGDVVDLFGWSTVDACYGINTRSGYDYYTGFFADWGKKVGDGATWYTLSKKEWKYLLESRYHASRLYKRGVNVLGKPNCLIIAPDDFTGSIESSYPTISSWAAAEAAGLVCIVSAGFRSSFDYGVSEGGGYSGLWTSTSFFEDETYDEYYASSKDRRAMLLSISRDGEIEFIADFRAGGYPVRLVTDVK